MGEKEDWSLVRVLTKLVRDCSLLGHYTRPKQSLAGHAKPSQARPQGIACPGSILMTVKKKELRGKKGEVDVDLEWFGDGRKEEGFESKSNE